MGARAAGDTDADRLRELMVEKLAVYVDEHKITLARWAETEAEINPCAGALAPLRGDDTVTALREMVAAATVDWLVVTDFQVLRDVDGGLHDLDVHTEAEAVAPWPEPDRSVEQARTRVTLPLRELTATERAERDEVARRRSLRAEADAWKPKSGPPPEGVTVMDLLAQSRWWRGQDGNVHRVGRMEPAHRLNLLAWLERRAVSLASDYLSRFMTAPDEVYGQAEHEVENPTRWLRRQRLVKRLRNMADADRAAVMAGRGRTGQSRPVVAVTDR